MSDLTCENGHSFPIKLRQTQRDRCVASLDLLAVLRAGDQPSHRQALHRVDGVLKLKNVNVSEGCVGPAIVALRPIARKALPPKLLCCLLSSKEAE